MKKTIAYLLVLVVTLSVTFGFTGMTTKANDSNGSSYPSKLGINLDGVSDWSEEFPFTDAMKASREWGKLNAPWAEPVEVDSLGWPKADASVIVFWDLKTPISGRFLLVYDGSATVSASGASISEKQTAGNTTTAFLTVTNQTGVYLNFSNTSGGVKNVKLIRPGYYTGRTPDNQTFTNEFLKALEPFSTIRYMTWLATNSQNNFDNEYSFDRTQVEWADRRTPAHASQAGTIKRSRGVAWEYVIELANLTGKDLWINLPANSSDEYQASLANMLKRDLKEDLNVYVEYGNEVWNWQFQGTSQSKWLAESDADVQSSFSSGEGYIGMYAKKVVLMARNFRNVYGQAAMNHKIRVVLAWQFGWKPCDYQPTQQLEFIKNKFEEPSNLIYSLSVAPYFSESKPEDSVSKDIVLNHMSESSDSMVDDRATFVALAKRYDLAGGVVAYEGGPHHQGQVNTNLDIRIAAHRDPQMKEVVLKDLKDNWFDLGAGLFCYFTLSSQYGVYGSWGLTENINDLDTPKFQAIWELYHMGGSATSSPAPEDTPSAAPTSTQDATSTDTPSPTPTAVSENTPVNTATATPTATAIVSVQNKIAYAALANVSVSKVSGNVKSLKKLTVFKKANTQKGKWGFITKGKKVVAKSISGKYTKIKFGKKTGYVLTANLKFYKQQSAKIMKASYAYKQAKKGAYYKNLKKNEKVVFLGTSKGYAKIRITVKK